MEIILEIGGVACLPGNKKLVEGKTEPSQEKSLLATISLFVFATSTSPLNNNETKVLHQIQSRQTKSKQMMTNKFQNCLERCSPDSSCKQANACKFFVMVGVNEEENL